MAVQLQAEILQTGFFQLVIDHIQSRLLLGDKENLFAVVETFRDHIGNGLAFSGAGRPLEYEAFSAFCQLNGLNLAGIGIHHRMQLNQRIFHRRASLLPGRGKGGGGIPRSFPQQRPHIAVFQNLSGVLLQILIHVDFQKGKNPQLTFVENFPAHLLDRIRDLGIVDRQGVPVRVIRQGNAVLRLEKIVEGGIDHHIVVADFDADGINHGAQQNIDMHQKQGCAVKDF